MEGARDCRAVVLILYITNNQSATCRNASHVAMRHISLPATFLPQVAAAATTTSRAACRAAAAASASAIAATQHGQR